MVRLGWIRFENLITRTLLLALVGIVFMEVILRSAGSPTTWSTGYAQLIFIWIVFLGANKALRNNAHVGIDIIVRLLPAKLQRYLEVVTTTLILLFLGWMVYYGLNMTFSNTGRLISGSTLSYHYITLAIPVGAALMVITTISRLFKLMKNLNSPVSNA